MAKILEITENIISIGMEDNSIKEVRPVDLNFIPHIGDEVEVFETETRTIVQKKEPVQKQQMPEGGIHINVENTQVLPQHLPSLSAEKLSTKLSIVSLRCCWAVSVFTNSMLGKSAQGFAIFCFVGPLFRL